eukprot:c7837_g1_i1.p1 GENE.c7837_g1_i1~~c7837_g1_i1.p1  ORF type:complete len:393 (-),score=86.57 c7837_g1_i1:687-1865(-)
MASKVQKQPKAEPSFFQSLKGMFESKKTSVQRHHHTDWDEVFKYKTFRVVVFLDARLGLLNILLMVLIVLYVILFALFRFDDQHLVVDALDLVDPPLEHGALFVASRLENTKQTRGVCGNSDHECTEDADCLKKEPVYLGKCIDGLCQEMGWCPPSETASDDTQVFDFEHPENVTLWIKAAISFPHLAPNKIFTTITDSKPIYESENPEYGNAYYLSEILKEANVALKASKMNGAMINLLMRWECDLETERGCASPILKANRLDVGKSQGFFFHDADYERKSGGTPSTDIRFYSRRIGYRLLISSKGTGTRTSIAAIILQVSSGLALLGAAKGATDFLMLMVLPQREYYRKYKEEETPDFSDLREKIKEAEEETEALRGSAVSRYAVAPELQ